jgi:hypothetical protein
MDAKSSISNAKVPDGRAANGDGAALLDGLRKEAHIVEPPVDHGAIRRRKITLVSSAEFAAADYQPEWLIPQVLVKGQPAVMGGPRKTLKTNVLVDLAISLAAPQPRPVKAKKAGAEVPAKGTPQAHPPPAPIAIPPRFLGNFAVPKPMRVGLLSGESGAATVQETARRICQARGTTLEKSGVFWGFNLPRLADREDLEHLHALIEEFRLEVVILDPLYLMLLAGHSETEAANLFQVGPLLSDAAQACLEAGATPILAHHARKYRPADERYEPLELEDLAYAGIAEFARQWILISRREKYDFQGNHKLWLNVGGSAGFGGLYGLDVREGLVDDHFRGRTWKVRVLAADKVRGEAAAAAEQKKQGERAVKQSHARTQIIAYLREHPQGETEKAMSEALGLRKDILKAVVKELHGGGVVVQCVVPKGNGQSYPGYRHAATGAAGNDADVDSDQ